MMLEFNGKRVMFTGDAQSQAENDFCDIAAGINTDVDVLKVAHHGSEGSSTERFLNKVRPEYAVISVGQNSYTSPSGDTSHPHQKALDRLAAVGAAVFRTDTAGDIVLTLTADGDILWYNSKNGDITAAAVYTGEYGALFLFLSKKAPCAVYD